MKTPILICIVAVLLTITGHVRAADAIQDALQKGLLEEETNHNLEAAVTAYQSVMQHFQDERKIAATATFRLGECYRKQAKNEEALDQFERVVRDFSDQAPLVQLSQRYLADAGRSPKPAASTVSGPGFGQPALNPEQVKLLREEIALVQEQLRGLQIACQNGRFSSEDLIQTNRMLIPLLRQLPENASPARQEALIREDMQAVQDLLSQMQKRIETGQASPTEQIPLKRDMLRLQRELLAVKNPSPPPQSSFQTRLNQIVRTAAEAPDNAEAKDIQRLQEILRNSPDLINAKRESEGVTPLQNAAAKGQLALAEFLLDNRADVNGGGDQTPLHYAALNGHKAVAELLISRGANVNAPMERSGNTPLHSAASHGFQALADLLISKGAEVNARTIRGETPLQLAVANRHKPLTEFLLNRGADVNAQQSNGRTPLMAAVETRQPALVELILTNRAEVNARDKDGLSALGLSVQQDTDRITELLLDRGADPNVKGNWIIDRANGPRGMPLHRAAYIADRPLIELLLKHGADIDSRDDSNRTPLAWAVSQDIEATRLLLSKKANPNVTDNEGRTPLLRVLEALLADKNQRTRSAPPGESQSGPQPIPSMLNAIVDALLASGASPNAGPNTTPLWFATRIADPRLMIQLLDKGADVNLKGWTGYTPLHLAAAQGNTNSIQLLLSRNADANVQDDYGNTPLHYAGFNGNLAAVQILLSQGAKPDIVNADRQTPAAMMTDGRTYQQFADIPVLQAGIPPGTIFRPEHGFSPQQKKVIELLRQKPVSDSAK